LKHLDVVSEFDSRAVAPVSAPGRGLKPLIHVDHGARARVAPVSAPGRGLKLDGTGIGRCCVNVAPVSAPGRGLKQKRTAVQTILEASPRCPHRGAD